MGPKAKKSGAKKKKRVSKHIREAIAKRQAKAAAASSESTDQSVAAEPVPKKTAQIKDPQQPINYLNTWKTNKGEWKFNTNHQTWLLKHMFDSTVISKGNFVIMMEYMEDAADKVKERCRRDAFDRAMRYKKWEEENKNKSSINNNESAATEKDVHHSKDDDKNDDDEFKLWCKTISDEEKRKEYKRSRKVLDQLKTKPQEED